MELSGTILWWLAAGILVAAELATGTFYLLILALGAVTAALAGHLGFGPMTQAIGAALVAAGATTAWSLRQRRRTRSASTEANPDLSLDIGQHVRVDTWASDGSSSVRYRGAAWSARYTGSGTPAPGTHVIVAVHGSQLQVSPEQVSPDVRP